MAVCTRLDLWAIRTRVLQSVLPAVHSRRVHLARVSGESFSRRDWASATLYTCRKLSIHERREQDESENKAPVGEGCSHVCWLILVFCFKILGFFEFFFSEMLTFFPKITTFPNVFCFKILVFFLRNFVFFFEILTFFFENYDLLECTCRLSLLDKCVDDFGTWHEATARWDTRPFDSCITNH